MTTYLLGVQREDTSIRLALVRRANSGKTTLVSVSSIPAASLKNWVREHIPHNAPVSAVLSVPESHIILKELELPNLKPAELAEAVHWELVAKSSLGSQSVTSWQVVEKRDSMLRVAAMIMKKDEVAGAVSFFADAGVELTAIEPSSISAGRILTISDATNVLLFLEGSEVLAVFLRNRVPVFSTSFSVPLTGAAIRSKHFSRDATASLVSQLKQIIVYWNAKNTPVASIIVVSEAALYSGLKSDVERGLSVTLEAGQADAALVGATKRVSDDPVNFLPKENRASLEKKVLQSYVRMRLWQFVNINVFILIVLAALSGFLWVSETTNAATIIQTQRFVDKHPAQRYVAHMTSVNTLAKEVSTLIGSQEDTGVRLRYLSSVTPSNVHFTSLKMAGGAREEWVITGTGNRGDILAFYYKLKVDGTVGDVTMPYSNFDSQSDSPFTVSIIW